MSTGTVRDGGSAPFASRASLLREQRQLALPLVALVCAVVGGLLTPDFASSDNLQAILRNASIIGIGAVGLSLVTISGNFISLGLQQSVMLAGIVFAVNLRTGLNPGITLIVVIMLLMIVSLLQGVFIAEGLNPVVTTLAAGTIIFGAVSYFADGEVVTFEPGSLSWLSGSLGNLPVQVLFFIGVTVVATWFVRKSVVGRKIRLAGANSAAAAVSGISVRAVTAWAFLGFGLAVTIAGVLGASLLSQASPGMYDTLTIDVVSAILVGGIAVEGGTGSPWQAAMGAVFISLVNNLLVLHGATIGIRLTVSGVLVIGAVMFMNLLREDSR